MGMGNPPLEDVTPIEHGGCSIVLCLFTGVYLNSWKVPVKQGKGKAMSSCEKNDGFFTKSLSSYLVGGFNPLEKY